MPIVFAKKIIRFSIIQITFICASLLMSCQSSPLEFTLLGPSLTVKLAGTTYVSGSTYNYGNVDTGNPILVSGTLSNEGMSKITISTVPSVQVLGDHAADIVVTQPASFSIEAGGSQSFSLTIAPKGVFQRTARIKVTYNDLNFEMNLEGYAYGVALVADIASGSANPQNLTTVGSVLYFSADNGTSGVELWKSDGTASGTVMVKDINPGSASSNPAAFVTMGGILYFRASTPAAGSELWRSDGTEAGTYMIKDIYAGTLNSAISTLHVMGSSLIFRAAAAADIELWKSDGTEVGTVLVRNINPTGSSTPNYITVFGNVALFQANDGVNGNEAWVTDGTLAGTNLFADIEPGAGSSNPDTFNIVGSQYVFWATTAAHGDESRVTSGFPVPTSAALLSDIYAGVTSSQYSLSIPIVFESKLYFAATATNAMGSTELWSTDGTTLGTVRVKDICVGVCDSSPGNFMILGTTLYFAAAGTASNAELWKSDGTEAGTVLVKEINPTAASSPSQLKVFNGSLFFSATDGATGTELWKTDGTEAGTVRIHDINPGAANAAPLYLTEMGSYLYFNATAATTGSELYVYVPQP